jgi:hypothetical protein
MPIETFALVFTGGKSSGREKGGGVGVGVGALIGVAREVFGALTKWTLIPARAAPMTSTNKLLMLIPISRKDH